MKIYALTRVDGGVEIMKLYSGTVEEALAKWHPSRQADISGYREIQESDVPADRSKRYAWKSDLTVDQAKVDAKEAK